MGSESTKINKHQHKSTKRGRVIKSHQKSSQIITAFGRSHQKSSKIIKSQQGSPSFVNSLEFLLRANRRIGT